jgi:pyridoxine kinase
LATILALSSKVARGSVGLNAIVPALHAFGHDVIELPTVLLSSHPGHGAVVGRPTDAGLLRDMIDSFERHGWLGTIDAVLTGYLPTPNHVTVAAEIVDRVSAARAASGDPLVHLCDPVLGDDPKGLYIAEAAADAIRDDLVPRATIVTPNRFEAAYLARNRRPPGPAAPTSRHLPVDPITVATSIPADRSDDLLNVATEGNRISVTRVPRRERVPNGTGDLFAAALLASYLNAAEVEGALGVATAFVDHVIMASAGRDELRVAALPGPRTVKPWPVEGMVP